MICVEPQTALLLYFFLVMSGIVFAWAWQLRRKKQVRATPSPTCAIQCEFCHHLFYSPGELETFPCPQCQLLNQKKLS